MDERQVVVLYRESGSHIYPLFMTALAFGPENSNIIETVMDMAPAEMTDKTFEKLRQDYPGGGVIVTAESIDVAILVASLTKWKVVVISQKTSDKPTPFSTGFQNKVTVVSKNQAPAVIKRDLARCAKQK